MTVHDLLKNASVAVVERLMFLSIPGLRPVDVHDAGVAPNLYRLTQTGASVRLVPSFPCVTSPVQASMLTGCEPDEHGVIANGFYWPDRGAVEFWVGHHDVIERPTFFTQLAQQRPDLTSAVWHAQNIKGADANFIITPSPIHEPDGTMKLWCYSKPDGVYEQLLGSLDHFPLQHYWGPMANIKSTQWILDGAMWLAQKHAPNFQFIYLPHLDYAGQKFGPNSTQAKAAVSELDSALGEFFERYNQLPGAKETAWVVAGEYALTPVSGAVFPNRILRQAGLLKVREENGFEYLDLAGSDAFAMVDHQFAHIFVNRGDPEEVAELFAPLDAIADVLVGRERSAIHMNHARSAPVIIITRPDKWLAYYWWLDDAAAPPFAHTVDIHAKPGYDPVEMFINMPQRTIPLDASLVKGSHGAPAHDPHQQTMLITSHPQLLENMPDPMRDVDVFTVLCKAFGMTPPSVRSS